jgi:hypothetical protein
MTIFNGGIPPYQRGRQGVVDPSFAKRPACPVGRGEGRFPDKCRFNNETFNKISLRTALPSLF